MTLDYDHVEFLSLPLRKETAIGTQIRQSIRYLTNINPFQILVKLNVPSGVHEVNKATCHVHEAVHGV